MAVSAINLTNLTRSARHIKLNECSDRRCTFPPTWMSVMYCRGHDRFSLIVCIGYRQEEVQTKKAIAARLVLDVNRFFPEIRVHHLGISISIYICDRDASSGRCQPRKQCCRYISIETVVTQHQIGRASCRERV